MLFLSPLRGWLRDPPVTHGLRRGLHSFAASRLIASLASHPRLTPWAALCRRFAAAVGRFQRLVSSACRCDCYVSFLGPI